MTFEMHEILRSKSEYRRQLAARPVAEKLRLLDQLRERAHRVHLNCDESNSREIHWPELRANSDEMTVKIVA